MRRLLAIGLLAAACNTGFEPQYRVKDLRILGVQASVTEVVGTTTTVYADLKPGQTVHLEALVADPLARLPRDPIVLPPVFWYVCLPDGTDSLPPCLDPEVLKDPSSLEGRPGVIRLGQGLEISVDTRPYAVVLEDALSANVMTKAETNPSYQCILYDEIPVVVIAQVGDVRDVAFKRVRLVPDDAVLARHPTVKNYYDRNRNPGVPNAHRSNPDTVCIDGPLVGDPFPSGRLTVCAFTPARSTQDYNVCDSHGIPIVQKSNETLSWQWYVTAGEFPEFRGVGNATGDDPDFERAAEGFTMWVIARDGRGGEAWATYGLDAMP